VLDIDKLLLCCIDDGGRPAKFVVQASQKKDKKMRVKSKFIFNMDTEQAEALHLNVTGKERPTNMGDSFNVIEVFKDTPQYELLVNELKCKKVSYTLFEDEIFTKKEELNATILQIVPNAHKGGYPQPEEGEENNDYLGVSFDSNTGCKYCTNGRLQDRPLRLRSSVKMGKSGISGIWWLTELIVTKEVRAIIESENLTGCEFWPVIKHGKDVPFDDIYQLKITGELPGMDDKTNIIHEKEWWFEGKQMKSCPNGCGERIVKGPIYYRHEDLINVPDFALTKEWFGSNKGYWRWPFMSQKAYRVFDNNKIKGVRFYLPIEL
jgi:hypothetical protein